MLARAPAPSWAELDLIGRAWITAHATASSLPAGAAIYVTSAQLAAMVRWPADTLLSGFEKSDGGFSYRGHPVKASGWA